MTSFCLQRLATTDWFTSRVSSCGIFATAYSRAPQHLQSDLRQLYAKLCHDDTPMVRRSAAFRLGKLAESMQPEAVSNDIIPLFQDLTQDGELLCQFTAAQSGREQEGHESFYMWLWLHADQDSVRLLAVETCGPLTRLLSRNESVQHVLPIVQKFAQVQIRWTAVLPCPVHVHVLFAPSLNVL